MLGYLFLSGFNRRSTAEEASRVIKWGSCIITGGAIKLPLLAVLDWRVGGSDKRFDLALIGPHRLQHNHTHTPAIKDQATLEKNSLLLDAHAQGTC